LWHRQITQGARLVLDSFLSRCPPVSIFAQLPARKLLYESDDLMAIFRSNAGKFAAHHAVGQFWTPAERSVGCSLSLVLQGRADLLLLHRRTSLAEFHFDFDSEPGVRLEIGVKANHWVSLRVT